MADSSISVPITIDPRGISLAIAAELRRMADAIDPDGAARPTNFHAPIVGGADLSPGDVERIVRLFRDR